MKRKFKGTSGDWKVIDAEDGVFIFSDSNLLAEIEEYNNQTMFNALLISKAPELLSMLESIVQDFESDYVLDGEIVDSPYEWLQDRYKEAKQLIEEATNI